MNMPAQSLDLDIATPEELPRVLRAAAQQYAESQSELSSAWQDSAAGRVWQEFARILNRAADSAERAIQKHA